MKFKFILIIAAIALCCPFANAQSGVPNYLLAGQLKMIVEKIGLPVDSAATYLKDFVKVENTPANETVYKSNTDDVFISFEKNDTGAISIIKVFMAGTMVSTAEKAIVLMGMIASGTTAPPGYTAYATPKYAAFLNPKLPNGYVSMVLVQGGK